MAAVLRCYDVSRQSVCSFRFRDKRATQLVYIAVAAIFLSRSYASTTSVKWPDRTSSWLITVESYVYIYIYMYILQKEAEHGGNDRGLQSWRKRKRSDWARKRERENGSWTLCREKGEKGVGEAEAEPEEMTERDALWDTESSNKAGPITDYRPFPFPIDLHSNRCYTLSSRILMDYQFESSRELQSSTHSLSTQNRLLSNPPISTVSSIS